MLLEKWRHYSFDADSISRCQASITRHNLFSLRLISAIVACMLAVFCVWPLIFEHKPYKVLAYLVCAVIEGCVYLYSHRLNKKADPSQKAVYGGFLVFFITLMAFGLYVGVWEAKEKYATNYMIYMVCSQLLFVFTPTKNLVQNLASFVIFAISTIRFKEMSNWSIDVVNAIVATLCSIGFNWYISHTLLKEKVTSLSIEDERNHFRQESETDSLTNMHNRRYFFNTGRYYLDAWQKAHKSICMLMIDIDKFKQYNDGFGHPKGDEVLRAIGAVLREFNERQGALAARVGGEEFAVLFAENRLVEAEAIAQSIHRSINALAIPHPYSKVANTVTTSIGLYFHREGYVPLEDLYHNADKALYQAKENGRNRIVCVDSLNHQSRTLTL